MKIAISTPIGTAISAAMPTRIAEPTISGAIPPPGWPKSGRSLVRKPIESCEAPRLATDHTTIPSTATAMSAAIRRHRLGEAVDEPRRRVRPPRPLRSMAGSGEDISRHPSAASSAARSSWASKFVTSPITSRIAPR